jgi:phage portal protein BeeE
MKISQSPWYHRLIISMHYSLSKMANPFGVSDNLVLINYILEKNSRVLSNLPEEQKKNYQFDMLDFITDNTEKLTQHLLELRNLYPREIRKMQPKDMTVSESCSRDDALGDYLESDRLSIIYRPTFSKT